MVRLTCAEARNKFEKKIKKRRSTEALRLYYILNIIEFQAEKFLCRIFFFQFQL